MKLTLNEFFNYAKTKVEQSSLITGLWIARSMIGLKINDNLHPAFGFAASFDYTLCKARSIYELLEHAVFSPFFHTNESINQKVNYVTQALNIPRAGLVKEFLNGSHSFYGNGCAIYNDQQTAINHATRELLERHLCCEIWYKQTRPLFQIDYFFKFNHPKIDLKFFTIDVNKDGRFIISALECEEMGFFALGAALKPTLRDALAHAMSEVIMLFEDVKKQREGYSQNARSKQNILSLREKMISHQRKEHFKKIIRQKSKQYSRYIPPVCQVIVFEPFRNMYAARAFSMNASDPRYFEKKNDVPVLPLF